MNDTLIVKLYKKNNIYTDISIFSVVGSLYTASIGQKKEADIIHEIIPIIKESKIKIDEIELA